jgi:hypothetical protein
MEHVKNTDCPGCKKRTDTACLELQSWFWKFIKPNYPDVHVSWGYRGKEDQEKEFAEGATRAHYPKSPHNRTNPKNGQPESYALDLFQQINGKYVSDPVFFAKLDDISRKEGYCLIWGGNFKSIGDSNHFQFNPDAET